MGGDEPNYIGPWELLSWWHPARLLGYDLRRWIEDYNFHIGDDRWQYGRSKTVAREMLHSAYAPTQRSDDGEVAHSAHCNYPQTGCTCRAWETSPLG